MSTWNDDRLDELNRRTGGGFKEVKAEIKEVRAEIKDVRTEMRDGFAQTVTRDEMNERFNAVDKQLGDLTRWVQALVVVVGGAFVGNGLLG